MALLDTGATLSVVSESFADQCISKACRQPPDLEATSASNHRLNLVAKARVPILVGGKQILTLDVYIARGFFRDVLFGIDFMNVARR